LGELGKETYAPLGALPAIICDSRHCQDWNDSIVVNRLIPDQVAAITAHGESVLNAAMASLVFHN
jgi:hypothetical protein